MKAIWKKLNLWLCALRWIQWIKGAWILFALVGRPLNTPQDLYKLMLVFIAVSLLSGGIYINNDLHDIEKDRMHPTKKDRPFASGALTKLEGKRMLFILGPVILVLIYLIGSWWVAGLVFAMALSNYAYTKWVKNIPYFELLFYGPLSSYRYWMGAAAVGNPYIFLQSIFVAFTSITGLALLRLMEKERYGNRGRRHVTTYSSGLLRAFILVSALITVGTVMMFSVQLASWMFLPAFGASLFLFRLVVLGMQSVENPEEVDDIDKMIRKDLWLKILLAPYVIGLLVIISRSFMR